MDKIRRLVALRTNLLVSILLGLWTSSVWAQSPGGMSLERFAREAARIEQLPAQERATPMAQLFTQFILDRVWASLLSVHGRDGRKPSVEIVDTVQSPYLDGEIIVIPVRFLMQMNSIALMMGHDIAVNNEETQVRLPLLYRPLGASAVFPLVDRTEELFGDDSQFLRAAAFALALRCDVSSKPCMQAQAAANMCGVAFVLAHESTHLLSGHKPRMDGAYPLNEEILADSKATEAMRKILIGFQTEAEMRGKMSTTACLATPAAYFELWRRYASPSPVGEEFNRRKLAYLGNVAQDERGKIERLLQRKTAKRGFATISLAWAEEPHLLTVDGIRVAGRAAKAKQILLPEGAHTLFAAGPGGFAFHEFKIYADRDVQVSLSYRFLDETDVSTNELRELRTRKEWFGLFLATSDKQLQPRSSDYAVFHWEALRALNMGAWINPESQSGISSEARKRGTEWANESLPLLTWDEKHARGTR